MKLAASKSSKIFRQTLAFFLAMLMFLTILPPTAFAEPGEGNGVNDDTDNMTVDVITPPDTNFGGGNGYEPDADPPEEGGAPPYADEDADSQYATPTPTDTGIMPFNVPYIPEPPEIQSVVADVLSLTVSWDPVDYTVEGFEIRYIVERRPATPVAAAFTRVPGPAALITDTHFIDTTATVGGVGFIYRVRAVPVQIEDEYGDDLDIPIVHNNLMSPFSELSQPAIRLQAISAAALIPTITQTPGSFEAVLSWSADHMASSYIVQRRISQSLTGSTTLDWDDVHTLNPAVTEPVDGRFTWRQTVAQGNVYLYRIVAVYELNNEINDSNVHRVTSGQERFALANMAAPEITHINMFSVGLRWEPVAGATFNVERRRSTETTFGPLPGNIGQNLSTPSFVDTSVQHGHRYVYQIRVVVDGQVSYSLPVETALVPAPPAPSTPDRLRPTISQTADERFSATITWEVPSILGNRASEYQVWRRMQNADGTTWSGDWPAIWQVGVSPPGLTQITGFTPPPSGATQARIVDNGVLPGRVYEYIVVAIWRDTATSNARPVPVTVVSTATQRTTNALTAPVLDSANFFTTVISWDAPVVPSTSPFRDDLVGFHVYRRRSTQPDWERLTNDGHIDADDDLYLPDQEAYPGFRYYYAIVALFHETDVNLRSGRSAALGVNVPTPITAAALAPEVLQAGTFGAIVRFSTVGDIPFPAADYIVERRQINPDGQWSLWTEIGSLYDGDLTRENIAPPQQPAQWRWELTDDILPSVTYEYRIVASWSDPADTDPRDEPVVVTSTATRFTSAALPPLDDVVAVPTTPTAITIRWSNIPDAHRFELRMVDEDGEPTINPRFSPTMPTQPFDDIPLQVDQPRRGDSEQARATLDFLWNRLDWNHPAHPDLRAHRFEVRPVWLVDGNDPNSAVRVAGPWVPASPTPVNPINYYNRGENGLNLRASSPNPGTIVLEWDTVRFEPGNITTSNFRITRTDELTSDPVIIADFHTGHIFRDYDIVPGRTYFYTIEHIWPAPDGSILYNQRNYGRSSERISHRTEILIPQNFRVVEGSALPTSVEVSWTQLPSNIAGYIISSPDNRDWDPIEVLNVGAPAPTEEVSTPETMTQVISNLMPNSEYVALIQVFWIGRDNQRIYGTPSAPLHFRTGGAGPLNLSHTRLTSTEVVLEWDEIGGPAGVRADRYQVFKDGVPVSDVQSGTTFTYRWLTPGIRVTFTVQAFWDISDGTVADFRPGAHSLPHVITPVGTAPGRVRGTHNSPTSMTVHWDAVPGVSGYRIELGTRDGIPRIYTVSPIPATGTVSRRFDNLAPNTQYQVRVEAIWDAGRTPPTGFNPDVWEREHRFRRGLSGEAILTTTGPAPTGVTAIIRNTQDITVAWNAIARGVNETNLVGYYVHFADRDRAFVGRLPTGQLGTSLRVPWIDPNTQLPGPPLDPNTQYPVRVEAVWDVGRNPTIRPGTENVLFCPDCLDCKVGGHSFDNPDFTCATCVVCSNCGWERLRPGISSAVVNVSTIGPAPGRLRLAPAQAGLPAALTPTSVRLTWDIPARAVDIGIVGYQISRNGVPIAWVHGANTNIWTDVGTELPMGPGEFARYTVEAVWTWVGEPLTGRGERPGISSNVLPVTNPGPAPTGLRFAPNNTDVNVPPFSNADVSWRRVPIARAEYNFTIDFAPLTGVNATDLVAYNVYIDGRGPIRVPARQINVTGRTAALNARDVTESLAEGTGPRTARIALNLNNYEFPLIFNFSDGYITPNTQYNIRVQGVWSVGGRDVLGPKSVQFVATTLGTAPVMVAPTAAQLAPTHIDLRWNRIPKALGYEVHFSDGRPPFRVSNPEPPLLSLGEQFNANWFVSQFGAYPNRVSQWHPILNPAPRPVGNAARNHPVRFGDVNNPDNPRMRITGLQPNTTYTVQVLAYWAYDTDGIPLRGNFSAPQTLRTTGPAPSVPTAGAPLPAVDRSGLPNIDGTASGRHYAVPVAWNFAWNINTNVDMTGFLLYRNGVPHRFFEIDGDVYNPGPGNVVGGGTAEVFSLDPVRDRLGNIIRIDMLWRDAEVVPGIPVTYMVQAFWGRQLSLADLTNGNLVGGGIVSGVRANTPSGNIVPAGLRAGTGANVTTATSITVQWNAIANLANGTGDNRHEHARVAYFRVELGNEDYEIIRPLQPLSHQFTGLTPNTLYPVRVTVYWFVGNVNDNYLENAREGRSTTVNLRTTNPVPAVPAIVAGSLNGTSVRLNWGAVAGARGYIVYRDDERLYIRDNPDEQWDGGIRFRFEDFDLRPGIAARYSVRAFWCTPEGPGPCFNTHDLAGTATCMQVSTRSGVRVVTPPGAVPGGIRMVNVSPLQFDVIWNVVPNVAAARVHEYVVELWHDGVNITDLDSIEIWHNNELVTGENRNVIAALDTRQLSFRGLDPNTRYQVRVRAIWDAGANPGCDICHPEDTEECNDDACDGRYRFREGNFSGLVNAQTNGPAPAGLRVAPGTLSNVGVRLTWNPVAVPGVQGYMIYRNSVPVDFITADRFRLDGNGWWDRSLVPGVAVRYTVRAYWVAPEPPDAHGNRIGGKPGNRTAVLTVTPPATIPTGVVARVVSSTSVSVSWNAMAASAGASVSRYLVEILQRGTTTVVAARYVQAAEIRIALFENLFPNTAYQVRVTPVWDPGPGTPEPRDRYGRPSGLVNVTTTGAAPGGLREMPGTRSNTAVTLNWNPVLDRDVVGYVIFRNGEAFDYITRERFIEGRNTWTDPTVRPGVLARYAVRAVWDVGTNPARDIVNNEPAGLICVNCSRCSTHNTHITPANFDPTCETCIECSECGWVRFRTGNITGLLNLTPFGAAPGGVTATINSPTQLTVRWNAVAVNQNNPGHPTHFVVRVEHPTIPRDVDPDMSFMRIVSVNDLRVLQFDGLQPNVRYRVTVAGVWDAGQGNSCCGAQALPPGSATLPAPCGDCEWVRFREGAPSAVLNAAATSGPAPRGLRVVPGSSTFTSVSLTWDVVPDTNPDVRVAGYLISRDGVPIDFVSAAVFRSNNNVWAYHGQNPGVISRFTVQACWSVATFRTEPDGRRLWNGDGRPGIATAALAVSAPDNEQPRPAPSGVVATINNPTSISVTWNDLPGVHQFRVELLQAGRAPQTALVGGSDPRRVTFGTGQGGVGSVDPNTAYQIRVVGIWDVGTAPRGVAESLWQRHRDGRPSALVNARTTGPAPTALRVAIATGSLTHNRVTLAWNPPVNADDIGVYGYLIYRNNVPIDFIGADDFRDARNTWTDRPSDQRPLTPNVRVTYSVQATWARPSLSPAVFDDDGNWIGGDFDARGNWIPNGKPGLRSANLNVTPPLP